MIAQFVLVPPPTIAPVPRVVIKLEEASLAVGLSADVLKYHIQEGLLPAKRSGLGGGGRYLILVADLLKWFDALPDA